MAAGGSYLFQLGIQIRRQSRHFFCADRFATGCLHCLVYVLRRLTHRKVLRMRGWIVMAFPEREAIRIASNRRQIVGAEPRPYVREPDRVLRDSRRIHGKPNGDFRIIGDRSRRLGERLLECVYLLGIKFGHCSLQGCGRLCANPFVRRPPSQLNILKAPSPSCRRYATLLPTALSGSSSPKHRW